MGMDEEWKKVYESRARRELPEHLKGYWTKPGYEQLLRVTLGIARGFKDAKTVLDVGSGIGRYCHELSKLGFKTYGVDYSQSLVKEAREAYPKLKFEVSSGYKLRFTDRSFDIVVCIGVLQCVEDYARLVCEICRVSAKYIILSTLLSKDVKDLHAHLQEMLKKDSYPTREYHPDQLSSLFAELGFSTEIITHENGYRILDGFFVVATRNDVA